MTPEELQRGLAKALGWDPVVAEGVVEAVQAASGQAELDGIIQVRPAADRCTPPCPRQRSQELAQDYMGGSAEAAALVARFRPKAQQQARHPQVRPHTPPVLCCTRSRAEVQVVSRTPPTCQATGRQAP